MIYEFDWSRESIFIAWNYVFMSLSFTPFGQIYDKLSFPFSPPDDLRQLAHDYVVTFSNLIQNSPPEPALMNLIEGVSEIDSQEPLKLLLLNAFAHLERMGYAEAVYRWGIQTHSQPSGRANERALDSWKDLLEKWAALEWLEQRASSGHQSTTEDWQETVSTLIPSHIKSDLQPLSLSVESRKTVQNIVLYHATRNLQLRTDIKHMLKIPQSPWDDFALHFGTVGGAWLILEGDYRTALQVRSEIAQALSAEEIRLLNAWVHQHQKLFVYLKMPLPDIPSPIFGEADAN